MVFVPNIYGTMRFCVEYGRLNQVKIGDTYPFPLMDDCIERFGDSMVFYTLVENFGYWQISVATKAIRKTCFTEKLETYQCKRIPLGLRNSLETFQRALYIISLGFSWKYIPGIN